MSLLEQFDFLRQQDPSKRLDATARIFKLLDIQPSTTLITNNEELKAAHGQDVAYTFIRLLKGLSSNRESARLGFSACLSELLRSLDSINVQFVLQELEKFTTVTGNAKGQEVRDGQFGRLFGIQAIVSSDLLLRSETTMEDYRYAIGLLYELSMSKGWLRESCAKVIILLLERLWKASEVSKKKRQGVSMLILELLKSSNLVKTMEGIAIIITCDLHGIRHPDIDSQWKSSHVLHSDNFGTLAGIMKDAESTESDIKAGTGTWKPKLHFSWSVILKAIDTRQDDTSISFAKFWRQIVDEGLFSQTASHERKSHGLQLFGMAANIVSMECARDIFSPNLMRTLINQLSKDDRYLHKAARSTMQLIVNAAKVRTHLALTFLECLMGPNGSVSFDKLTKTKTCAQIMDEVQSEQITDLITFLVDLAQNVKSNEVKDIERERQQIAEILVGIVRSKRVERQMSWITPLLKHFIMYGFFIEMKTKRAIGRQFSTVTQELYREKLRLILGLLATTENGTEYALEIVRIFRKYDRKKSAEPILQPDEQVKEVLNSSIEDVQTLSESYKSSRQDPQAAAFTLLYTLAIVQLRMGEPDAVEVLNDLAQSQRAMKESDLADEDGKALIDILLALLSKESSTFRKIVDTVFTAFAPKLTDTGLELLLNVLSAPETGEGLFDQGNDLDHEVSNEDTDGNDENDDDDDDDDDEDTDDTDDDQESNDDINDDDIDVMNTEGTSEGEDEADKALDDALIAALGKRKAEDSEEESEEELMDDEEMLKMDDMLTNIFKRRKQEHSSTRKEDAKAMLQNTVQLKSKVLDLLDTFVREQSTSVLILKLIVPLLQVSRSSKDSKLVEKAQNLVKQRLTKSKVLPNLNLLTSPEDDLVAILREIHTLAAASKTPPQTSTCSQAALFVVKMSLAASSNLPRSLDLICKIYSASQITWMTKKRSGFSATFFTDFVSWSASWRGKGV